MMLLLFVLKEVLTDFTFGLCKDGAIRIMNNSNLIDKMVVLYFLLLLWWWCIKISNTTYYQRNTDVILNTVKDYYEYDEKRTRRNKYKNLFDEEKNKKGEYGKNRYRNISEEKKEDYKKISKKLL